MTPRQKRIIVTLATANIAIILALVVLVTRPTSIHTPTLPHPHTPTTPAEACQTSPSSADVWQATQLLAQAGLGGTVTLPPDGSLCFEIVYPLAPGHAATPPVPPEAEGSDIERAAQSVWTAFDVALALQEQEGECATFTQVQVMILASGIQTDTQISASVSAADLADFSAGELSEDEFIKRVTYTTNAIRRP